MATGSELAIAFENRDEIISVLRSIKNGLTVTVLVALFDACKLSDTIVTHVTVYCNTDRPGPRMDQTYDTPSLLLTKLRSAELKL